jgi:hypothetical protein
MRAWLCLAACAALGLGHGQASADATPRALRVREPAAVRPTNLRMRPVARAAAGAVRAAAGAAGEAPGAPAPPEPAARGAEAAGRRRGQGRDAPPSGPSLAERVVFRFNIGFGLDGGQPQDEATRLNGELCDEACLALYTRNRIYGFGDAVLGSRGVLASSLNTYFAAQFRLDQDLRGGYSAVPSTYDGPGVKDLQVRSGYGELVNVFESRWLRPLYVRAGRQFRYGTAVAHFDGVTVSYDTRVGSLGFFGGSTVSLYRLFDTPGFSSGSGVSGTNARLDLAALGYAPVVLTANTLRHDGRSHADWAVTVRVRRDLDARARLRTQGGKLARADMQVRTRLSAVTVATLDVEHSTARDWRYDAFLTTSRSDRTDERQYLALEPPGPRTYVSLRAGTVLLDNVDLLLRGAGVVEYGEPEADATAEPDARLASSYIEGGAALELRLQRTLSLGLSTLVRGYRTQEPPVSEENPLEIDGPQGLGRSYGYAHARSFVEAGAVVRYTQGARLFSAEAETYARAYERTHLYVSSGVPTEDERVGGRLSVEAWAGERLRLRLEYDVSTKLAVLPELHGLKSLRVLMEGRF